MAWLESQASMLYSKEKKGHPQKGGKQGDVKENGKREKMVLGLGKGCEPTTCIRLLALSITIAKDIIDTTKRISPLEIANY